MKHLSKILATIMLLFFLDVSLSSQSELKMPIMFYPANKSFFDSVFCKKYQCTYSEKKKDVYGNTYEEFGFLDVNYTGILNIETNRSKIGAENWWYTGFSLLIDTKYHYNKSYISLSKNYINPDIEKVMSELLLLTIGKKYSKNQLIKCLNADEKLRRFYSLDEFLKVPPSTPITRVTSSQGGSLYFNIRCGIDKKTVFSIEHSP